jgi:hypothetical protein
MELFRVALIENEPQRLSEVFGFNQEMKPPMDADN